jgi:hypothetical protein
MAAFLAEIGFIVVEPAVHGGVGEGRLHRVEPMRRAGNLGAVWYDCTGYMGPKAFATVRVAQCTQTAA